MSNLKLAMIATGLFATAISIFSLQAPIPAGWTHGVLLFHISLVISVLIPTVHVIAALFFFLGLAGFKQELRRVYQWVAVGIVVIGFSLFESPMVSFFDLWDKWPITLGLVTPPYMLAMAIIFFSMRTLARSLSVQSRWRSLYPNIAILVGGVLLVIVAPHAASKIPELSFDIGSSMFTFTTCLSLITAISIFIVRRHLAPAYARVLTWLGVGIIFELSLVGTSVVLKLVGLDTRSSTGNLQNFLLIAGIPYLVSGYLFYRLTADTRSDIVQKQASIIDVVLYAESLASSAETVDPIMDGLRAVTSRLEPGQPLTEQDLSELGDVYLRLEQYLVQREPQRSFTVPALRTRLHQRFNDQSSATQAFWRKLPLEAEVQTPTTPATHGQASPTVTVAPST